MGFIKKILFIKDPENLILGLLFFLLPLAYWDLVYANSDFPKAVVFYFFFIIISLVLLFRKKRAQPDEEDHNIAIKITGLPFVVYLLMALLIWTLFVDIFAVRPSMSAGKSIEVSAKIFFLFLIYINSERFSLEKISLMASLGIGLLSIIGILHYFDINPLGLYQAAPPASTFVNRNHAAHYMGLMITMPLLFSSLSDKRSRRIGGIFIFFLSFTYSVFMGNRGLLLAYIFSFLFLAGLFLLFKMRKWSLKRSKLDPFSIKLIIISIITAIGLSFIPGKTPRQQNIVKGVESIVNVKQSSALVRLGVWENTLELIKDYPITGVGPDGFSDIYPRYSNIKTETIGFSPSYQFFEAHNEYLQYAAELGIPGGLMLLLLAISVPVITLRWTISNRLEKDVLPVILLSMGLINIFVHSLVSFPTQSAGSGNLMWPYLALWLGSNLPGKRKDSGGYNLSIPVGLLSLLLGGVMFVISLGELFGGRYIIRSQYIYSLIINEKKPYCLQLRENINRAASYMPFYRFAHRWRAFYYAKCNRPSPDSILRLEEYLKQDPYNTKLWIDLAEFRVRVGNIAGADTLLTQFLKIHPGEPEGFLLKGYIAQKMGLTDQSDRWYNKAVEINKNLAESVQRLRSERVNRKESGMRIKIVK